MLLESHPATVTTGLYWIHQWEITIQTEERPLTDVKNTIKMALQKFDDDDYDN